MTDTSGKEASAKQVLDVASELDFLDQLAATVKPAEARQPVNATDLASAEHAEADTAEKASGASQCKLDSTDELAFLDALAGVSPDDNKDKTAAAGALKLAGMLV